MGKRNHGSETLKWFYLWNTMQAGSHAAIQIKPFLVFHLKLTGLQLFKENKFIILSLLRKGGKLRAHRPSGEWKQNENTVRREWLAAARGNQSCKWTRSCSKWMQRGGIKGDLCRLKQNSQKKIYSTSEILCFFLESPEYEKCFNWQCGLPTFYTVFNSMAVWKERELFGKALQHNTESTRKQFSSKPLERR